MKTTFFLITMLISSLSFAQSNKSYSCEGFELPASQEGLKQVEFDLIYSDWDEPNSSYANEVIKVSKGEKGEPLIVDLKEIRSQAAEAQSCITLRELVYFKGSDKLEFYVSMKCLKDYNYALTGLCEKN